MWTAPDLPEAAPPVLGKYRLLVKLGQGPMGDVHLAGSEGLGGVGKLVVIERRRDGEDPQHLAMFLDRARVARQLCHPNIVQTHEIGREAGFHLVVMEYLEGPTLGRLRRLAADRGGVPWAIEIEVVRGVLDGLHHAHELRATDGKPLKIVHRDLSSHSVLLSQSGDCKILGFGVAKGADPALQIRRPPEQLRGLPLDRRADVFAAGVMLWEGLSGTSLGGDLGNLAVSTRLVQGDLPPLRELAPQVPQELREICETALAPQPEGRFDSALAMKLALMDYAGRNGLVASRAQVAELVTPLFRPEREGIDRIIRGQLAGLTAVRVPPVGEAAPRAGWRRVALAGAVALLAAGGVGLWQARRGRPPVRAAGDEAAAKYLTAAEASMASRRYEYARTMLARARAVGASEPELHIRLERLHDALEMAALLTDARAHLESQRWRPALEAARRAYERQPGNAEALELLNRAGAGQQLADASARSRPRGHELRPKKLAVARLAGRDTPEVPAAEPAPPPPPARSHSGAVYSPAPARVTPPALPRAYLPENAEQLRRMCTRVEAAVVSLAGIKPEYARGITGRFQAQVGAGSEIYPAAMYYFIVREAGLKHDNVTAAAALATAQRTRAILGLRDMDAIEIDP